MADFQNQSEQPMPEQIPGPIQMKKMEGADQLTAEMAQDDIVTKHMDRFGRWEDWRSPLESVWTEIYKLFFSAQDQKRVRTKSNITIPIVFQVIEAALPKLVTIIFGQPQWFSAVSRSCKNPVDQEILTGHEDLIKYQLELAGFFQKFVEFAKQLFLYGTSYLYIYWKVKREWVYERTPIREDLFHMGLPIAQNELRWEKKLVYKVIERRPEVEVLPIEDVYPDPDARNEEHAEGIYVVSSISKSELKELSQGQFPVYANYDKVEALGGKDDSYEDQQFKLDKKAIRGTGQPSRGKSRDMVELITYWGKEDLDGDGIREEVQMVFANRSVLIKAIRNPFEHQKRPVVRGVLFPVPNEWFGMGLIEPVIALIHELNTLRNQNVDQNNLIINRMWKVSAMADVDLDTLISAPNHVIVTGEMDGIMPIAQDPIPFSPIQMTQLIQGDIENTTAPKSIQGAPEGGSLGRTAKGAQLIISQALEKFGMGSKLIEETVIRRVLDLFKKLNEQFLDNDEVLAQFYAPNIPPTLTPEQIRADITFKMLGVSETITKEAKFNQMVAIYNLAAQNPAFNGAAWLKEMIKLAELNLPPEEFIQELPNQQLAEIAMSPEVSAGTEEAVVNQIQENGTGGQISVPQQ